MKVVSVITDPKVVDAILRSLARGACRDPFAGPGAPSKRRVSRSVRGLEARVGYPVGKNRRRGELGAKISGSVAEGGAYNHLSVTAEIHLKGRPETLPVSRNHLHLFRQM